MEEAKTDVKETPPVEEPVADAKDQPVVSQPDTGEVVVQPDTGAEDKTIPYDRFKEVNDAKKNAEAQLQAAQAQNLAYQQQMAQSAQPRQPETTYDQAVRELGLQAELYPDPEQRSQIFARKDQLDAQKLQQQQQYAQSAQFIASHPDYAQVAGVDNPATGSFLPSAELQTILNNKPWLFPAANSSAQARYDIVMQERRLAEFEKSKVVATERDNRQKAAATTAPMSGTAGAGGDVTNGQFNSKEDVQAMEARLAAGEFPTNRKDR